MRWSKSGSYASVGGRIVSPKDVDVLTPSPCELGNGVFADDCDAGMTVGSRPRGLVSFQKGDIWAQRPAEERPHVDPGRGQQLQKDPRPPAPDTLTSHFQPPQTTYIFVVEAASVWCFVTAAPANIKRPVFY